MTSPPVPTRTIKVTTVDAHDIRCHTKGYAE